MKKNEKTIKDFQKFLEEHYDDNMSQEELSELIRVFNEQKKLNEIYSYEDSDDYLEMAQNADNEKEAIKYVKKALKLDPNNIDAESYLITLTSKNMHEVFERYKEALDKHRKQLEKQGYFTDEYKGEFWLVIETRPYIRLWYCYIEALIEMGMMDEAIKELKEVLIWNEGDNCGGRYYLAHLYAYKQDKDALFNLHKQYDEYNETQFLLPKSILLYKNNDLEQAKKYLLEVEKCNPDIHIILDEKKLRKKLSTDTQFMLGAYRPGSYQELLTEIEQFTFLFDSVPYYFEWVNSVLKKKK